MFSKITLAQFPQVAIFGKANVKEPIRVVVIILFFLIVLQIRKSQSSKWNSERAERYKLTEFMNSDRKPALGTTTYIRNDPRVDSEKKSCKKGKNEKIQASLRRDSNLFLPEYRTYGCYYLLRFETTYHKRRQFRQFFIFSLILDAVILVGFAGGKRKKDYDKDEPK